MTNHEPTLEHQALHYVKETMTKEQRRELGGTEKLVEALAAEARKYELRPMQKVFADTIRGLLLLKNRNADDGEMPDPRVEGERLARPRTSFAERRAA